jgi:uncharacterized protein YqeY
MILDNIRASIKEGMKNKATDKVALLRLVVGTVQQDGDESDSAVEKIIRKLIKSNKETLDMVTQSLEPGAQVSDETAKLISEIGILETFIPQTMTVEDIISFITKENIDVSSNDGKAMGAVMKALKISGLTVQGSDVKIAIQKVVSHEFRPA